MGHGSIGYWVAKMVADSGYDELLSRVFGHLLGVGGLLDSVNHEICCLHVFFGLRFQVADKRVFFGAFL